jgi:prepilin-type processing-associated H-X9-DG protein/prepilin-type N-terminal cleavage/methylation domain-containing protein
LHPHQIRSNVPVMHPAKTDNSTSDNRTVSAFTLIELLVVMAIIAILLSLLLPVLSGVRNRGYQTQCINNLRQWAVAVRGYSTDNDGSVVWDGWVSTSGSDSCYHPYFGANGITLDGKSILPEEYFRWCHAVQWNASGGAIAPVCYAMAQPSIQSGGSYILSSGSTYNIRQALTPSSLLLITEARTLNITGPKDFEAQIKPICLGNGGEKVRHSGNANMLFADGHVGTYPWSAIDQDTDEERTMVESWFHLN